MSRPAPLAVFAVACLVFAPSATGGFAHDDTPLLLKNPYLHDLANLPRFFGQDYWAPTLVSGLYRPLVTLSYALGVAAGGLDPLGFHLVNILLHGAVSALVFALFRRLCGRLDLALAGALLFATHAVHSEVVANVSAGRPELLSALLLLLSLRAHLAADRRPAAGARGLRLVAAAAFGLALLCKESAVAWLGVVLLTDWLYGDSEERPGPSRLASLLRARLLPVYAPYAVALLAVAGLRLLALGVEQTLPPPRVLDNPLVELSAPWRWASAAWVGLHHARLLVFPLHLSYDYSYAQIPPVTSVRDPRLWAALAAVPTLLALAALAWRRSREVFYGLGFAIVMLSVVSNLVLPIGTILGERLLYVPSIGFCLAAVAGLRRLVPGKGFALCVGLLVLLHGARTLERIPDWRSEDAIWLHDARVSPRSARARSNAGAVHQRRGRCPEALVEFDAAIAVGLPPELFVAPYQGRVLCLVELSRFREAARLYERIRTLGPPNPEVERRIRQGLRSRPGG